MSKYKGLFTFDIDNHRYIPIGQADGIVVVNDADYATTEPLIKDPTIRKAVRAWAKLVPPSELRYSKFDGRFYTVSDYIMSYSISFPAQLGLSEMTNYTVTELCGEEKE